MESVVTNLAVRVASTQRVMCPLVFASVLITSLASSAMKHVIATAWNVVHQLFAHVVRRDFSANIVTTAVVLLAYTIVVTLTVDALVSKSSQISHIAIKTSIKNIPQEVPRSSLICL